MSRLMALVLTALAPTGLAPTGLGRTSAGRTVLEGPGGMYSRPGLFLWTRVASERVCEVAQEPHSRLAPWPLERVDGARERGHDAQLAVTVHEQALRMTCLEQEVDGDGRLVGE